MNGVEMVLAVTTSGQLRVRQRTRQGGTVFERVDVVDSFTVEWVEDTGDVRMTFGDACAPCVPWQDNVPLRVTP